MDIIRYAITLSALPHFLTQECSDYNYPLQGNGNCLHHNRCLFTKSFQGFFKKYFDKELLELGAVLK